MALQLTTETPTVMDRRVGRRDDLDLKVIVSRRGQAVAVGRVLDLGLFGMYLRTDGPALPKHSLVEAGISVGGPGAYRFVRLPAMVVRTDPEGMGLIFDPQDPVTRSGVRMLLRAAGRSLSFDEEPPPVEPIAL